MITPQLIDQAIEETKQNGNAHCISVRDGRTVSIYTSDLSDDHPILGALRTGTCTSSITWASDGKHAANRTGNSSLDLVATPSKRTAYYNVYKDRYGGLFLLNSPHPNAKSAGQAEKRGCIGRVRVEFEEGYYDD